MLLTEYKGNREYALPRSYGSIHLLTGYEGNNQFILSLRYHLHVFSEAMPRKIVGTGCYYPHIKYISVLLYWTTVHVYVVPRSYVYTYWLGIRVITLLLSTRYQILSSALPLKIVGTEGRITVLLPEYQVYKCFIILNNCAFQNSKL